MRSALVAASAVTLAILPALAVAQGRDEQAIRSLERQWVKLVADKNVAAIADLYAPGGTLMPPNAPLAEGREAITATWRGMVQSPGFALSFTPSRIDVARGRDMAVDRGTYRLTTQGASGPVEDRGKYVVVWRKVNGGWKVAADIFNSDLPIQARRP
jgi:uncharacterized protein (TIGR02246 family)